MLFAVVVYQRVINLFQNPMAFEMQVPNVMGQQLDSKRHHGLIREVNRYGISVVIDAIGEKIVDFE